jgi:hypothetical protein
VKNVNGQPRHELAQLYESLLAAAAAESTLSDECKHRMWLDLVNYETKHSRVVEEKEFAIGELKKSLCDLTEKRFRQQQLNVSNGGATDVANMEFLLNEKEAQVRELIGDLEQKSAEIIKLKQTIKDQDLIILSHNTNIYVS